MASPPPTPYRQRRLRSASRRGPAVQRHRGLAAARCRRGVTGGVLGPLAVCVVLILLGGCAPANRYRTLSFFFDGVPNPDAPPTPAIAPLPMATPASAAAAAAEAVAARPGPRVYHKPYTEFQCNRCHGRDPGTSGQLLLKPVEEGLCADCHRDIAKDARYVHAPVLVNACLQCHEPHVSNGPHLLLKTVPNVCARCHYPKDLSSGEHHRDAAPPTDSTCLSCHLPHGGPRRHLLRSGGGAE